jgi:formylglycine-generating enzyme required for sulfatase activity
MEDDHSQKEISLQTNKEDFASSDEVDHKRLARLIAENPNLALSVPVEPNASSAAVEKSTAAPLFLIAAALIAFLLLSAAVWFTSLRSKARPGNSNSKAAPSARSGEDNHPVVSVEGEVVAIPGGSFQMGRDDGPRTEGPSHTVTVGNFLMDKTEVTNAEYAQFVRETKHAPPEQWSGTAPTAGNERLPVSNVSYDDAVAFAAWRSKKDGVPYRLPTEEEWEYAARNGARDNLYPWGNSWIGGRAATQEAGVSGVQPVGNYPEGNNAWGVEDLIGNVWEWTSSKGSLYPGNAAQLPAQHKDWIVIRGGCYASPISGDLPISGTLRNWVAPNYRNPVLGFRLARSGT